MKIKWMILVIILLLVSCEDNNSKLINEEIKDISSEEAVLVEDVINEELLETENFIGTWITVVEGDYFDDTYSLMFFEDGSFITNDFQSFEYKEILYGEWLSGTWEIINNEMTLNLEERIRCNYANDSMDNKLSIDPAEKKIITFSFDNLDVFSINENLYSRYDYSTINRLDKSPNIDFTGNWKRTNVHQANSSIINIISQEEDYIYFTAFLSAGGHAGTISGIARINSNHEAEYIHNVKSNDNSELVYIKFDLNDGLLQVSSSPGYLGFGMNVIIDGAYTQEAPIYTNADIVMEIFGTEARLNTMKDFLGKDRWNFLELVMNDGYIHPDENLTYSGFISGLGQGADFLMTEDNMIYYLSYGEGPRNIFYTNDSNYKHILPTFLVSEVRAFNNIQFVYKGKDEEIMTDEYVWVRGHYEEPDSWQDSDSIIWDRDEGFEYIEVIVNGEIENLSLVTLKQDDFDGSLYMDEILYHLDYIKDQTVVMQANQPEGIPYEAIRFENKNGEVYYYIIEEKNLSGDSDALNEYIYLLSNTPEHSKIKIGDDNYLNVPTLTTDGTLIEDFIPNGWKLIDSIILDFNKDGLEDQIGVLEVMDYDYKRFDISYYPRILFVVKQVEDGSYVLDFQDINLIRNRSEGGIYGDPYQPLTTDGYCFEINTYGGSAWRWSERTKFDYFDGEWYLTEHESSYGYSYFVTHYKNDDYTSAVGVRSYNNDSFKNIEERGENWKPFEFTFNMALDDPPKLTDVSERWFFATDRLGEIVIEDIAFANDIDSDYIEKIQTQITDKRNIVYMDASYIMFRVRLKDSLKEYVVLYDRQNMMANVILEATIMFDDYHYIFNYFTIYSNKIFIIMNKLEQSLVTNSDGTERINTDTIEVSLNSVNFDGANQKKLFSYENIMNDVDRYPYISMGFEIHNDIIYYFVYESDGETYYMMNTNGTQLKMIGKVEGGL